MRSQLNPVSCLVPLGRAALWVWLVLVAFGSVQAYQLALPPRAVDAPGGSQLAAALAPLSFEEREERLLREILAGNVPSYLRQLVAVPIVVGRGANARTATIHVVPDYLAVGSDQDYFLAPMSPMTAQRIADALNCSLPTRHMVDIIYSAAGLQLQPHPMPPGPEMTSVAWFTNHNAEVTRQRRDTPTPPGTLIAGHKKDVVLTPRLASHPGKVAIYGWHNRDGTPIQPLYLGHTARWVDYSHGIRLVLQSMTIGTNETTISRCLATAPDCDLLSDEGPIAVARYPTNFANASAASSGDQGSSRKATDEFNFVYHEGEKGERVAFLAVEPEVRVYVNLPAGITENTNILILFYALPNGNTISQTLGKTPDANSDRRYDIQHVLAQTRFLRTIPHQRPLILVLLQSQKLSWPAWRKKHGDQRIPALLDGIARSLPGRHREIVLSGHSGGGSLIFGYLNSISNIPPGVVRISFLDSNYAYENSAGHTRKLVDWLKDGEDHFLCVLAYNDAVALLDGKPFVSAEGGTWGRSHAMRRDLAEFFEFEAATDESFQRFKALDGRLQLILKENPDRKIYHTTQVELNGLIHSMLTGTTNESVGYEYFGQRAYSEWIPAAEWIAPDLSAQ